MAKAELGETRTNKVVGADGQTVEFKVKCKGLLRSKRDAAPVAEKPDTATKPKA
jgi:hypothetical protein